MFFKTLTTSTVVLLVVLAIQLVTSSTQFEDEYEEMNIVNAEHNVTVGQRESGDSLLENTTVTANRRFLWFVNRDYKFPPGNNVQNCVNITLVEVTDLIPSGKGGYPSIITGGPGADNVTIHLQSRWNTGIDFKIQIFGFE